MYTLLKRMVNILDGRKVYILAYAMFIFAWIALIFQRITGAEAIELMIFAATFAAGRHTAKKIEDKLSN